MNYAKRHKSTTIAWFHSYEVPRIGKCTETESRIELPGAGRSRGWGVIGYGYRVYNWGDEKVL